MQLDHHLIFYCLRDLEHELRWRTRGPYGSHWTLRSLITRDSWDPRGAWGTPWPLGARGTRGTSTSLSSSSGNGVVEDLCIRHAISTSDWTVPVHELRIEFAPFLLCHKSAVEVLVVSTHEVRSLLKTILCLDVVTKQQQHRQGPQTAQNQSV